MTHTTLLRDSALTVSTAVANGHRFFRKQLYAGKRKKRERWQCAQVANKQQQCAETATSGVLIVSKLTDCYTVAH